VGRRRGCGWGVGREQVRLGCWHANLGAERPQQVLFIVRGYIGGGLMRTRYAKALKATNHSHCACVPG
jgi:hypothetical protein